MTNNRAHLKAALRGLQGRYRLSRKKLAALKHKLEHIFRASHMLVSTADLKKLTYLVARLTCELINTDGCILRLLSADKRALPISAGYRVSDDMLREMAVIQMGQGLSGTAANTGKAIAVYDIEKDQSVQYREILRKEGVRSALIVPLIFQNTVLGVISTATRKPRHFTREEIEVLNIFASHVAAAIKESQHENDIHVNYFNTIHSLVLTLEARDPYTRGHTERVTKYAVQIVEAMGVNGWALDTVRYAAQVHDVGKISIPDFILNKPGELNPAERAMIQLHPVKGVEILEPLAFLKDALPAVRHHHERYDGTGYPDRLQKDQIPLMARVLACADAFDAMTSDRPYRKNNLTTKEAISEIRRNCGRQFDPEIANVFISVLNGN